MPKDTICLPITSIERVSLVRVKQKTIKFLVWPILSQKAACKQETQFPRVDPGVGESWTFVPK